MVFGEEQFNVPVGSETWQTDSDTVVVSRLLRRTREFARRYFFSFTEKGGGGWGVVVQQNTRTKVSLSDFPLFDVDGGQTNDRQRERARTMMRYLITKWIRGLKRRFEVYTCVHLSEKNAINFLILPDAACKWL